MDLIRDLADLRDALRACVMFSGKPLKEIAFRLEIETSHLSKMLNPSPDPRHFPPQKIGLLMDVCGNEIPLLWMICDRGYPDPRNLQRLRDEISRLQGEVLAAKGEARMMVNVFKNVEIKE